MANPIDRMTKEELDAALDDLCPKVASLLLEHFSDAPWFILSVGTTVYRASISNPSIYAEKGSLENALKMAEVTVEGIKHGQMEW